MRLLADAGSPEPEQAQRPNSDWLPRATWAPATAGE